MQIFNHPGPAHLICPRCESYNATLHSTMTGWEQFLLFLSFFLVLPAIFLSRHYQRRAENRFFQGQNQATCRTCRHTFNIFEVELLPYEMLRKQRNTYRNLDQMTGPRS